MFIVTHCSLQQRVKKLRVDMHRDARGWMHGGELPLWPFQRAQRGRRCLFITVSLVISWFIKIDLKQTYCSYLDTQKIQNDFLQFLLLFLRSTLLIKETNIICNVFFLFLKSFHCPQLHYCSPTLPLLRRPWICMLCQQTLPKHWSGTVNVKSYCDVTNSVNPVTRPPCAAAQY